MYVCMYVCMDGWMGIKKFFKIRIRLNIKKNQTNPPLFNLFIYLVFDFFGYMFLIFVRSENEFV
jgi:hypothetical protein